MLLKKYINFVKTHRATVKNKKGGVNILLEFILLLPFFVILILLAVDVMKFYYLYNVTSLASYTAAYNFSMTLDVESSMDAAENAFTFGGLRSSFRTDDIKASIYEYDKATKTFSNEVQINPEKNTLVGSIPCVNNYEVPKCNELMLNREIFGVKFEFENRLLTTVPANRFSAGWMPEMTVPVVARNHIFEVQRFDK